MAVVSHNAVCWGDTPIQFL